MSAFKIKSTNVDEVKFGDSVMYFTGTSAVTDKLDRIPIRRKNKDGKPVYKSGLTEQDVKFNPYLAPEEKESWIKKLPEIIDTLKKSFGDDSLDEDNENFWREKGVIQIGNETLNLIFDDKNPENLLKKAMIMGGCFDLIAPTHAAAKRSGGMIQYYLIDAEEADEVAFDKRGQKPLAYELYGELKGKSNKDALLYLTWCLDPETHGYTKKTAPVTLQAKIEDFIEGDYVKRGSKKLAAEKFVTYAKKWKTDKQDVIMEAVVNACDHYGKIFFRTETGKYHTVLDDMEIGTSLEGAKRFLLDGRNRDLLLKLKDIIDIELEK
jgi:hypothetical protein